MRLQNGRMEVERKDASVNSREVRFWKADGNMFTNTARSNSSNCNYHKIAAMYHGCCSAALAF
jgi:hypothetical protein